MKNRSPLTEDEKQRLLKKNNECGLARTMGIETTDLDYGYARSRLTVGDKHLNALGILHGAVVLCLADQTASAAGTTMGRDAVALQINANYLAGAKIRVGETIYCEARFVKEGKQIVYLEIAVQGEKGDLIARATLTGIKLLN